MMESSGGLLVMGQVGVDGCIADFRRILGTTRIVFDRV